MVIKPAVPVLGLVPEEVRGMLYLLARTYSALEPPSSPLWPFTQLAGMDHVETPPSFNDWVDNSVWPHEVGTELEVDQLTLNIKESFY